MLSRNVGLSRMTYPEAVLAALGEVADSPEDVSPALLLHRIGELIGQPLDVENVARWVAIEEAMA